MSSVSKFLLAFKLGYDLIPSKDEQEYSRAKTRYTNAMADYYESGKGGDSHAARDANYHSQITDRTARLAETVRHNKAMEGKPHAGPASEMDLTDVQETPSEAPEDNPEFDRSPYETVDPNDPVIEEVPLQAKGGPVPPRVRRYANGGGVVEDEQNTAIPLAPGAIPMAPGTQQLAPPRTAALPQQPTAPTGSGMDPSAAEPGPGFSYQAGLDAAMVGLENMGEGDVEEKPKKAAAIPVTEAKAEDEKGPTGGATLEEIKGMDPVVDPKHQMSESDRVIAKLAHGYEGALKQGNEKLARALATDLMKTYKWVSNGYANLGRAKAEQGDVDGAIGAFMRAYNYIPDAKDLRLQKLKSGRYAYKYTDKLTGEVIHRGMATPDEILGVASRGFMNRWEDLVSAARDESKAPSPAAVEAISGVPGGPGATTGGSDPAAGGAAGSQPRWSDMNSIEEVKAVKAARDEPVKQARADAKDAAKEVKTDERDAKKAAAHKAEFDQKRLDEAQSRGDWTKENPAKPTTRAEFDALPVGAWLVNPKTGAVGPKKAKAQPATAQ